MHSSRFWPTQAGIRLAALTIGVLCELALPQSVQTDDSLPSAMATADREGLNHLLSYLQDRSRDLVLSRSFEVNERRAAKAKQIRENLLEGECLYILSEAEAQGYSVWVLSRQSVAQHREPKSLQTVNEGLSAWQRQQVPLSAVSARGPVPRGAQRADPPAAAASTTVPAPADGEIIGWLFPPVLLPLLNRCEHLTLQVPGAMATLPWAALPYTGKSLLIDHFSLSLLPDIQALAPARLGPAKEGSRLVQPQRWEYRLDTALVVGNPRYSDPVWLLPDLPGAQREAVGVEKVVSQTRLLLGEQATKTRVQEELHRQRWDMVYLATHAVADSQQPLDRSFVAMTPASHSHATDPNLDNGRWTAREVQGLKIQADIAVLSACQTGLGGEHDAGIIGIGRAFFLAGVPHVITSLWRVDDEATADFMPRFVQQIQLNSNPRYFPADSLRLAMLHAKREGKPVRQWASFVHFGVVNYFTKPFDDLK